MSEEIEGMVTKKLSKELSRTESRNMAALSKLDEFILKPQVRAISGTVLGTSWNSSLENQKPNEDHCQNDSRPQAGTSIYRLLQSMNSDSDEESNRNLSKLTVCRKNVRRTAPKT